MFLLIVAGTYCRRRIHQNNTNSPPTLHQAKRGHRCSCCTCWRKSYSKGTKYHLFWTTKRAANGRARGRQRQRCSSRPSKRRKRSVDVNTRLDPHFDLYFNLELDPRLDPELDQAIFDSNLDPNPNLRPNPPPQLLKLLMLTDDYHGVHQMHDNPMRQVTFQRIPCSSSSSF